MNDDLPTAEKFKGELMACFNRWWHESDLDEEDLARGAIEVLTDFTETRFGNIHFESDIDLDELEDE